MLKDGFLRFCDDPEITCCKAEAELGQLRIENAQLRTELNELQELANAHAEGRLKVLPTPIGAPIWRLHSPAGCKPFIEPGKMKYCDLDWWGEDAFLSREAAEKALETTKKKCLLDGPCPHVKYGKCTSTGECEMREGGIQNEL